MLCCHWKYLDRKSVRVMLVQLMQWEQHRLLYVLLKYFAVWANHLACGNRFHRLRIQLYFEVTVDPCLCTKLRYNMEAIRSY